MASTVLEENLIDLPPADAQLDQAISEKLVGMSERRELVHAPDELVERTVRQMKREAEITRRVGDSKQKMSDRLSDLKAPLQQGKSPKQAAEMFFGSEDIKKYLGELLVLEAALTETWDILREIVKKPKELNHMRSAVDGQLSTPKGEKLLNDPKLGDKILSGEALKEIMPNLPEPILQTPAKTQPGKETAPRQAAPQKPQGRVL